jgi:hypothetical protein
MQDMRNLEPAPSGLTGRVKLVVWQEAGGETSNSGSLSNPPHGGLRARSSGANQTR